MTGMPTCATHMAQVENPLPRLAPAVLATTGEHGSSSSSSSSSSITTSTSQSCSRTSPEKDERAISIQAPPIPATTPAPQAADTAITIVPGYRPGILSRTLEMHLDFYYPRNGWGRQFEAVLSTSMGDLLKRLDRPVNQVWSAVWSAPSPAPSPTPVPTPTPPKAPAERIVGVVYVDGECTGEDGVARLRCFIVDESVRGRGVGRRLLNEAMEFVRRVGFRECRLSTMRSLTAARRLYESVGFVEAGEYWFEDFGKGVWEMKYVWRRSDDPAVVDKDGLGCPPCSFFLWKSQGP
ncbi:hypothetical protein VTJ83DRAFT_2118 [Remersonia thermophila]|uniref:N-acetyltransferase domain-containing protein n=1 Tax=Remersonia thermophila TaxID=72144 RepID=A0ABR4DI04_9PEZI